MMVGLNLLMSSDDSGSGPAFVPGQVYLGGGVLWINNGEENEGYKKSRRTDPAVRLRSAVSRSSRSVGCGASRSLGAGSRSLPFREGGCSRCIVVVGRKEREKSEKRGDAGAQSDRRNAICAKNPQSVKHVRLRNNKNNHRYINSSACTPPSQSDTLFHTFGEMESPAKD